MDASHQRAKAFEAQFEHDELLEFRIRSKRNKLLAAWLSDVLGYDEQKAIAYEKEIIRADFQKAGDEDLLSKVMQDLDKAGLPLTHHRLEKELIHLESIARHYLMTHET